MDSDRRAFLAGLGGLVIVVIGILLPSRGLRCALEARLFGVDHELHVFSHVDEPTVFDVTVTHPPSGTVTLSDSTRLSPEGRACYFDPFTEDGEHLVTITVRGGPSGSELAGCCLHASIKANRIDFSTAFN